MNKKEIIKKSTKNLLFIAYCWNMLGKLIVRSLGIASTLVLVRLLDPKDFGIVAIGMMIIGFFQVLTTLGLNRYLILKESPSDEDYDSAWTLNIILRLVVVLVLALFASSLSSLFENPSLENVIYFLCVVQFLSSFRNIGMVKLEKELNYQLENKVLIAAKVVSFLGCLITAYYLQNYYALLVGNLINTSISVTGSYIVSNYRPKLNIHFSPDMFYYSKFLMVRNVVGYTRSKLDILIVGKLFGDIATGQFTIARQFSTLPQSELISPAMQPLFSGLSKFKNEPEKLMTNSMHILQVCYLLLVPCAFGLLAISEPFTIVVLGEKWLPIKDFLGILAFLMIIFVTQPILNTIYDANNKVKHSMWADCIGIISLMVGITTFGRDGLNDFAVFRVWLGLLTFVSMVVIAKYIIDLSIIKILEILSVPTVCSIMMFYGLMSIEDYLANYKIYLQLIFTVIAGVFLYCIPLIICIAIMRKFVNGGEINNLINHIPVSFLTRMKLAFLIKEKTSLTHDSKVDYDNR